MHIHTKVNNLAIKWDKLSIQETRMNLKCIMPPRLKTHIYYDSISISFSKRGDYQNGKLTSSCQMQGKALGWGPLTTRHTWESVELLNVLIIVVFTRQHIFVKTQNCTVNSMNITVCKLYLLKRPTISRSNMGNRTQFNKI